MANPEQKVRDILDGPVFLHDLNPNRLAYNEALGFLEVPEATTALDGIRRLVGFGVCRTPEGGFDSRISPQPILVAGELDPLHRTIDLQGKGVGPRMYNTPSASQGLTDAPDRQGVYLFDINPEKLHDTRSTEGSSPARVIRHGKRILQAENTSLDDVVAEVHASYGDNHAVLFTQPPRAKLRQMIRQAKERRAPNPVGVPSEFILIRSAAVSLRRVGVYTR